MYVSFFLNSAYTVNSLIFIKHLLLLILLNKLYYEFKHQQI